MDSALAQEGVVAMPIEQRFNDAQTDARLDEDSSLPVRPAVDVDVDAPPRQHTTCFPRLTQGPMCRMLLSQAVCSVLTSNEPLVSGLPLERRLQVSAVARGIPLVDESYTLLGLNELLHAIHHDEQHTQGTLPPLRPFIGVPSSPFVGGRSTTTLEASLAIRQEIAQLLATHEEAVGDAMHPST